MKPLSTHAGLAGSAIVLAAASIVCGAEPAVQAPLESTAAAESAPMPPSEKFLQFLKDGKLLLNVRARYEYADEDGLRESHAPTFRTRLGYETAKLYGFQGLLEFEDIRVIGNEDNFNQAGLSGPGRTVVADPETTEVNQAWISYEKFDSVLKGGRQRIILDNHRFVGNVGWRQNEQTFDAVSVQSKAIPDTTAFYSYVYNVNRVFGDDHPMGDFDSDSHLFNVSYAGCPFATLTAYTYLLDFENSPGASSDTFGLSLAGSHAVPGDVTLQYRAEYAFQRDAADNPSDYQAHYYNLELGASYQRFNAGAGYEVLGSDNGVGFATPLATLHAFNGWADAFLATPGAGLEDIYAWAGVKLPYDVPFKLVYHHFGADRGSVDFGHEWDAVVSKTFAKNWTALAKYAYFDGDGGFVDRQKFWLQLEFAY